MSKRGENIHKRKDGRWEGRYKKGRNLSGAIIYGSVYGKTYREVKDKMALLPSKSDVFGTIKNSDYCFCDVLSLWMKNNQVRLKLATVNKYQNIIDTHILPELGKVKLSDLTSTTINVFLTQKLQSGRIDGNGGLSASYVRSIMLIINAALEFAANEQMCPSLKSRILKPSAPKEEIEVLSVEEQRKLVSKLFANFNPTSIGILISLYAGLRIGEVCALTWDDIDLKNHLMYVHHTVARVKNTETNGSMLIIDTPKTKASDRIIPISSTLFPILKRAYDLSCSQYVISEKSNFLSPRTYEYRYHRLLDKCGIKSVNYHVLRHTFATRCIEAGVDVKSLSEILGHANVSITLNTYVHSSIELKRSQLEKLSLFSA